MSQFSMKTVLGDLWILAAFEFDKIMGSCNFGFTGIGFKFFKLDICGGKKVLWAPLNPLWRLLVLTDEDLLFCSVPHDFMTANQTSWGFPFFHQQTHGSQDDCLKKTSYPLPNSNFIPSKIWFMALLHY